MIDQDQRERERRARVTGFLARRAALAKTWRTVRRRGLSLKTAANLQREREAGRQLELFGD